MTERLLLLNMSGTIEGVASMRTVRVDVAVRLALLVIGPDTFLVTRSERLAELALEHAVPAVFEYREFVAATNRRGEK